MKPVSRVLMMMLGFLAFETGALRSGLTSYLSGVLHKPGKEVLRRGHACPSVFQRLNCWTIQFDMGDFHSKLSYNSVVA
jgi:hypothetical protein